MRILVRTSKLAIWSRRLALFAAALIFISGALHVFAQIASIAFETTLIIGSLIATLALVFAIAAYVRLWITGDKGWAPATAGFLVSLLCLTPAMLAATLSVIYPSTADVTTAFDDAPALLQATPNHPEIDAETVLQSFPNLITRIYQIPPEALFVLAQDLVRANEWTVLEITEPTQTDGRASLNALRRSLLGFENEIVFRISASPIGAQIDLRAASLEPVPHDLGDNGRAIEGFLLALDDRVSVYIQDNLATTTEDQPPEVIDGVPSDEAEPDPQ
ncbi:DUF1499 domain-containing protein [Pelagibacterium luteolum]|uniref:DUF1499 domain-containing protein n=1 Tax=Pelagibacterium luteolum TaxID=440168 RepID=A0A1G7TUL3_9HYPH|nr:DUF1499 domain-containing protein [Pelagibacterium luteolum]SDG38851.1 Protein of unknown function [Pelagibacterium luteolum]